MWAPFLVALPLVVQSCEERHFCRNIDLKSQLLFTAGVGGLRMLVGVGFSLGLRFMLGREWVIGSIRTDYRSYCRDCYTTSFAIMPVIHHALHGSETLGDMNSGAGTHRVLELCGSKIHSMKLPVWSPNRTRVTEPASSLALQDAMRLCGPCGMRITTKMSSHDMYN